MTGRVRLHQAAANVPQDRPQRGTWPFWDLLSDRSQRNLAQVYAQLTR